MASRMTRVFWCSGAVLLGCTGLVQDSIANNNVYVSRFWHNHQPIYWPEWNSNGPQTKRVQFAADSIALKSGQIYDSTSQHPENDLTAIFSVQDRVNAYQSGPRNSLANVNSGGYAMSYSGSLMNNVQSLGANNQLGYGAGWWNGNREARGWFASDGGRKMDLVGFTYHHSLAAVIPKSVFRKELQIFHEGAYKAWGTGSITNRSKGFFPTEMAFSRHMIDVLADEGYEWAIVASHHLSRTLPSYMGNPTYTSPENNSWKIYSSPPNKADQIGSTSGGAWWFGTGNVGETAWNHAPYAYQLHKAKYVNPETGAEKTIMLVPSDDIQSYKAGYSGWQKGLIDSNISPYANDPTRPCLVMPSTDGDNAWGGGSSSWDGDAPGLMNNGTYPGATIQGFVNNFGQYADTVHIEDGAWIFPETCYGSPQFLKWVEPPVANATATNRVYNTQVDMETPGFATKFYAWAPVIAGANWCETAEQMWTAQNGAGSVANWKIQDPYNNFVDGVDSNPNIVERAWNIYLAGLDSGFNYYGGLGNDDEIKSSLATRRAQEILQTFVNDNKAALDNTPPTVFKPQRFPYNPGAYTFGWFNNIPGNNNSLKKMKSEFYVWTHAYDVSGVTSIVVKIRKDNDGSNPINSNQNETFAGGGEVGNWVTVTMTKRVLPSTAAALTAAANNSQIAYFSQGLPLANADYYFARIDDGSFPNFRGNLFDYYIEAYDGRGNVSKSDIQHVWVENDGFGGPPPASASFSVDPRDCAPLTVTYSANNGALSNINPVIMWSRFATNGSFTSNAMSLVGGGTSTYTFATNSIPNNAPVLQVYFQNSDGSITDNSNGANYSTAIRDCEAPQGPVWTQPSPPVAGQTATIYYNPTGRVLAAAASVNIHHGYNGANWTTVPGVPMTQTGIYWTFTYTVPQAATSIVMVFNQGGTTWDNNSSANWTFAVDTQPVTNAPAAPAVLTAQAISSSLVSLSWNASSLASAYLIYRDDALLATTSSTSYNDTQVQADTTYSYYVKATNVVGLSGASASTNVTTPFATLASGTILILNPVNGLATTNGTVAFSGRAAFGFDMIMWSNRLSGQSGTIARPTNAAAYGWTWNIELPLAGGSNQVVFSGMTGIGSSVTNTDSAALYTTWTNGSRQGSGFNEWFMNHSASNAGHFLADSAVQTNMHVGTSKGFGLWANNGGRAAVTRSFVTPMKTGDSFAVRFDNNWINTGSQVGFEMRDGLGAVRLRFYFVGGESFYRITDSVTGRVTAAGYTDNGLALRLTLTNNNEYFFSVGANPVTGTLGAGGAITWLEFYNNNAGPDTPYNVYVGDMSHIAATTGSDITATNVTVVRSGAIADSNNDGIPDSWFGLYGLDYTNNADGISPSGATYREAYLHDINPNDPLPPNFNRSYFPSNAPAGSVMMFEINPSSTARLYNVFWVPHLLADWTNTIGSYLPGTGSNLFIVVTNNLELRYYRTGVKLP